MSNWQDEKKEKARGRLQALEESRKQERKQQRRLGGSTHQTQQTQQQRIPAAKPAATGVGQWRIAPQHSAAAVDGDSGATVTRNIEEIIDAARRRRTQLVKPHRLRTLPSALLASPPRTPPSAAAPTGALPPHYVPLPSPVRRIVDPSAAAAPGAAQPRTAFYPLECFDDTTLETRTPEQWLRGSRRAHSKWFETDGTWRWAPCEVVAYNPEDETWTIAWIPQQQQQQEEEEEEEEEQQQKPQQKQKRVSRLNLRFDEEDAARFERRLEAAVRSRCFYERLAARNARLGMKDLAGLPELPSATLRRVLALAASGVRDAAQETLLRDLVQEVRHGYRVANKQTEFDSKHPIEDELDAFMLPLLAQQFKVRRHTNGTIDVVVAAAERRSVAFRDALAAVAESLPAGHKRIHRAQLAVWAALLELRERKLLQDDLPVSDALVFRNQQKQAIDASIEAVRKEVEPIIVGGIMQASNEEERDKADKAGSARFFKLVRMANAGLRDTLVDVALSSLERYVVRVESFESALASLREPHPPKQDQQAPLQPQPHAIDPIPRWVPLRVLYPPLFRVTLEVGPNGVISFDPPLEEFTTTALGCVVDMLDALRTVPPLDVATVEYRHFDPESVVSIPSDHAAVVKATARITKAVRQNVTALKVFRDSMREYEPILATNVVEQVAHFSRQAKGATLVGYKFEIEKAAKLQMSVRRKIEDHVPIALFEVDCRQIKAAVVDTCKRLQQAYISVLHEQAKTELSELTTLFTDMQAKLSKEPMTPPELIEATQYIEKVTTDLPELVQKIANLGKRYQLLEDCAFDQPQEEFDRRWQLVGWPRLIRQTISGIEKTNSVGRLRMIRELRASQKELEEKIISLESSTRSIDRFSELDEAFVAGDKVRQIQADLLEALEKAKLFDSHERLFGFKQSDSLAAVQTLVRDFDPQFRLWSTASAWLIQESAWLAAPFTTLNAAQMTQAVSSNRRAVAALLKRFRGQKESAFNAASKLRDKIEAFRAVMPLVSKLRHPGVRRRHWDAISSELHFEMPSGEQADQFTLGKVLDLQLDKHQDVIAKITDVAINEHTLESALEKMLAEMRGFVFELSPFKSTGTSIIHSTDDLSDAVEDQWVRLQTMLTSPYIEAFSQRANSWKGTLSNVRAILVALLQCQKNWVYLWPILSASDIRTELPTESRKFQAVDATWRKIITSISNNPKVLTVCSQETLLRQLEDCNKVLETVHAALNEFLETKRARFNRFYFLSNDELLDILAHSRDPNAVQVHMAKLFENIASLDFGSTLPAVAAAATEEGASTTAPPEARGMVSAESERVAFIQPVVTANREVEGWLLDVEAAMRKTLQARSIEAVATYGKLPRDNWIASLPAQAVLLANQTLFTQQATRALMAETQNDIKVLRAKIAEDIADYASRMRGDVTPAVRCAVTALMTLLVHNRDVVTTLSRLDDPTPNCLEWKQQLRFYWEGEVCTVRILQSEFQYCFEYLGNTSRLVLSPLTDRVYHTLCNAISLFYGGSLAGPAGTGKTETVRDLARALGKQNIIFNCSSSLNYNDVGKMLKGAATTGAWCTFDEFNRIEVSVLSVVATQVQSIQQAIAARAKKFRMAGTTQDLPLNASFAIHVTMNPGYAGRSELPDNLKALFRPVAMSVADTTFVAETLLFCEGFQEAVELARKLTRCLTLCSEQLSSQVHYDFGMRSLKTVLSVAGASKRREPLRSEDALLVDALRRCNGPKLLARDLPVFEAIIGDLFPQLSESLEVAPTTKALGGAIADAARAMSLEPTPEFCAKCMQLYETMRSRHGVALVGEAASGKTSCYRVLGAALDAMAGSASSLMVQPDQKNVQIHVISPKAISLDQLYGFLTPTLEWIEGIVPKLVKVAVAQPASWHWIVFDGPIDSVWVETLNSCLDNTKVLCLTNGERIAVPPNLTMMFEVTDLAVASPATVSRCGMVYMDASTVTPTAVADGWMHALPPEAAPALPFLKRASSEFIPLLLSRVRESCTRATSLSEIGLVVSHFSLLSCFVDALFPSVDKGSQSDGKADGEEEDEESEEAAEDARGKGKKAATALKRSESIADMEGEAAQLTLWHGDLDELAELAAGGVATEDSRLATLEAAFAFSAVQTIGCAISESSLASFDTAVRESMKQVGFNTAFPGKHPVYEWRFSPETRAWEWFGDAPEVAENRVNPFQPIDNAPVLTTEVACRMYIMEALLTAGKNVFLLGESGLGKTFEGSHMLFSVLDQHEHIPMVVPLSRFISGDTLRERLESALEKRKRGGSRALRPPDGKCMVAMLDNLHTPLAESSGAQPPIEVLRTLLDHGGWHEAGTHGSAGDIRRIESTIFVGAATLDDALPVSKRLLRHFSIVWLRPNWQDTLPIVLGKILQAHLAKYGADVAKIAKGLAVATVSAFKRARELFRPTVASPHYRWNQESVVRIVRCILAVPAGHKQVSRPSDFVRLWMHEAMRIFGDRLREESETEALCSMLHDVALANFPKELEASPIEAVLMPQLTFAELPGIPFGEVPPDPPGRAFDAVQAQLADHNAGARVPLELHISADGAAHVVRIARVLRAAGAGGNALLIGVSGSGRRSLALLAASMAEAEVIEPGGPGGSKLGTRNYGEAEWIDDLRRAATAAGLQQRNVVLLLRLDALSPQWAADIGELMHDGVVARSFAKEDRAAVNLSLRSLETRDTLSKLPADTTEHMFQRFALRTRANLHVVATLSPFNRGFRELLRIFPPLVESCSCVEWFGPWTADALDVIGRASLAACDLGADVSAEAVSSVCVDVHRTAEDVCARYERDERRPESAPVPSSKFLDFLRLFRILLGSLRGQLTEKFERLEGGLSKLDEAASIAAHDQKLLEELMPVLEKTSREEAELLASLTAGRDEAQLVRDRLQEEEKAQAAETQVAAELQQSAEAALQQALPVLNAAKDALSKLSRQEINEIKALSNPPATMTLIIKGLCILFQRKPKIVQAKDGSGPEEDYWPEARQLMDASFLKKLLEFDSESITDEVVAKLKPLLAHPQFQPSAVERVNVSLKSLAGWIRAVERFYAVSKSVAPKRKKLEEANARLAEGLAKLEASRASLRETEQRIAELEARAKEAEDKRLELERKLKEGKDRLDRAERLLFYLGSEKTRWAQGAQDARRGLDTALGDSLLAASCITYLGPLPALYRSTLLTTWRAKAGALPWLESKISKDFSLARALGSDEVRAREWRLQALPSDAKSLESALVATSQTTPPPMFIDPQGQALRWLLNMEQANGVQLADISSASFIGQLESCVQFGKPLVVPVPGSDGEPDPVLAPLLSRERVVVDGQTVVQLGDHTVPLNARFRMYLVCSASAPRLTPEAASKVNVIDFSVSREGLTEQFLARVVGHEEKELELRRTGLLEAVARHNKQLKELESRILGLLHSAKGDILSDEVLIEALSSSKKASDEVSKQLAEAERVGAGIEEARAQYRPIAAHASLLFTTISEFGTANPMYQFSLEWFSNILEGVMDQHEEPSQQQQQQQKAEIIQRRVAWLSKTLTTTVFSAVCRAIFEEHKAAFALLLAARISQSAGRLTPQEWAFFLTGTVSSSSSSSTTQLLPTRPDWVSEAQWAGIVSLSRLPAFSALAESVSKHVGWKDLFVPSANSSPLEQRRRWVLGDLPRGSGVPSKPFSRLLLVRAARLDALTDAAGECVKAELGETFLDPPRGFDIEEAYAQSAPQRPILLVLAPGADPAAEVFEFADRRDMGKRVTSISLGAADVGAAASRAVRLAIDRGDWVLLANVHLAGAGWMPELERLVKEIPPDRVHEKFRLWLTSLPSPLIPTSVLHSSVKATVERPSGVRAGLARAYSQRVSADALKTRTSSLWHKLVYGACFLHATAVERARFGALGWNKAYSFNDSDLAVTLRLLDGVAEATPEMEDGSAAADAIDGAAALELLQTVRYIAVECVYGGYVTEAQDRRLLDALADTVYTPAIADDAHELSESGRYVVPEPGTRDEYLETIHELPLADEPEVFGLHENAAVACAQREARGVLNALSSGLGGGGGGGGSSSGGEGPAVEDVRILLESVPKPLDEATISKARPASDNDTLNAVLLREVGLYNALLKRVRSSLSELADALRGFIPFTPTLEALHREIGFGSVPEQWSRVAYLTAAGTSLTLWMGDLTKRVAWISKWASDGDPQVFWAGGLFRPQAFLAGVLQRFARKTHVPLDHASFSTEVLSPTAAEGFSSQDGVSVALSGLSLQGASWENRTGRLAECSPNQLFCELPPLVLRPREDRSVGGAGAPRRESRGGYHCPVYVTLDRVGPLNSSGQSMNFVTQIVLPSDVPEEHWIKRGTALFCKV